MPDVTPEMIAAVRGCVYLAEHTLSIYAEHPTSSGYRDAAGRLVALRDALSALERHERTVAERDALEQQLNDIAKDGESSADFWMRAQAETAEERDAARAELAEAKAADADDALLPWERPIGDPQQQARDIEACPYTRQERRAAQFIEFGGGDDPVGFLIVSTAYSRAETKDAERQLVALRERHERALRVVDCARLYRGEALDMEIAAFDTADKAEATDGS